MPFDNQLTEYRRRLLCAGFAPLPVIGKQPPLKEWQKRTETSVGDLDIWAKLYPRATNTGALTRLMPTLDIDILNPDAAAAVETLVREQFEHAGYILVRFGNAPKRAIPFRTLKPFKKITAEVIAPDGTIGQKFELLAEGQQVVVGGTHPDTRKPYAWFGGELGKITLEELPYIDEAAAKALVSDAVQLLLQYGYTSPQKQRKNDSNNFDHGLSGWFDLVQNIHQGNTLHDSLRDLAAKLITAGMGAGAATNLLRDLLLYSDAPRGARFDERYADIPRAVASAANKFQQEAKANDIGDLTILSSSEFTANFVSPDQLIEGILQREFIYALTGHTGRGKSALALLFSAHIGLARLLGHLEVEKGRVLYLACENPTDIRNRWIAMSQQMDFEIEGPNAIAVHFIEKRFPIAKYLDHLKRKADKLGGFDFVVVDSSAAFFQGDDENNNAQAGKHAAELRALTTLPGKPGVLTLCHPPKNAGDDNLQPRGGGAYVAEIDGNLTAGKDEMTVTLHWQTKLRGPDFAPLNFLLRQVTHERLVTRKGKLLPTIVASLLSDTAKEEMTKAARADEDLLLEAFGDDQDASITDLARTLNWLTPKGEAYKSKVQRILERLQRDKLLTKERGRYTLTEKGRKALK